jgi:hypothetical protein
MGLKLTAEPTFKSKVGIPLADGTKVDVAFTFKHRTKSQLHAFLEEKGTLSNVDAVLAMVEDWELDDPFNRENVERLLENYIGAVREIPVAYVAALYGASQGN